MTASTNVGMELLDHLRGQRAAMVDLLSALVRAESPSHDGPAQDAVLALLTRALRERAGHRVRRLRGGEGGDHLLSAPAERPRRCPLQLLLCHGDTVWPRGTLAGMPLRIDDAAVHGPGAFDAKAGLVQIVFALAAVRARRLDLPVTPVVLVNSDEEVGSRTSTRHIARVARIADRSFVLEPSLGPRGVLKTARKGIGRFTIHVTGQAAHAGLDPGKGASAILELAHVVQSLFALNDPARGVTVNVGTIDGGLRPNVVAPTSRAVVDVRVPTHDDAQRVEAAIRALQATTPGTALRVEGGFGRPPMERTDGNRRLWELALAAGAEIGIELEEAAVGGASDGNTTSQLSPTLDGLGGVGDGAHSAHEHTGIDALVERTALLARLLLFPPLARPESTPS